MIADRKQATMREEVRGIVEKGSQIHSDQYAAKWRMDEDYTYNVVNHLEAYVQATFTPMGLRTSGAC